jgi:hypothetical protein
MKENNVFLDTSIQLDRLKMEIRRTTIEERISKYKLKFTSSFVLLEFKATILQEMITIHGELSRQGAKFTTVRDNFTESMHRQRSLRGHIFNNFISIQASSRTTESLDDLMLAERARLILQDHIPEVYSWFRDSVDSVLKDILNCTRAFERPVFKKRSFDTNLPTCKRGKNKYCSVETVIRSANTFSDKIDELAKKHDDSSPAKVNQFRKSLNLILEVVNDNSADLSSAKCRQCGDLLIAMEAKDFSGTVMSTNSVEWEHLSVLFGFNFDHMTYTKG